MGLVGRVDRLSAMAATPRPPCARAPLAFRMVGVLAVLAGLIGMHGLASHEVTGIEAKGHAFVATATSAATAPNPGVMVTAAPSMPVGMDMEMAGWCIAILLLGLGAVSMLLRGKGLRLAPWVFRLPTGTVLARARGRDPDPPSLILLSIQRC